MYAGMNHPHLVRTETTCNVCPASTQLLKLDSGYICAVKHPLLDEFSTNQQVWALFIALFATLQWENHQFLHVQTHGSIATVYLWSRKNDILPWKNRSRVFWIYISFILWHLAMERSLFTAGGGDANKGGAKFVVQGNGDDFERGRDKRSAQVPRGGGKFWVKAIFRFAPPHPAP